MRIALIGYGKMGKAIEEIALERGHTISCIVNSTNSIQQATLSDSDVAIEFTQPHLAVDHITHCVEKNVPIVVGTTAWNESLPSVKKLIEEKNGCLLHASNFSIGVNIFFEVNKMLARLMTGHPEYSAQLDEIHHLQKLDSPSGTAITLANGILENNPDYLSWVHAENNAPHTNHNQLGLISYRKPDVPGTHSITYKSTIDTITITHEAHNRKGFALGAVLGAEFIVGKKGIYSMSDVLNIH